MFGIDRNVSAGQFNQSSNISRREPDTDVWKLMAKMGGRASIPFGLIEVCGKWLASSGVLR
jgi:hypothetical protein